MIRHGMECSNVGSDVVRHFGFELLAPLTWTFFHLWLIWLALTWREVSADYQSADYAGLGMLLRELSGIS